MASDSAQPAPAESWSLLVPGQAVTVIKLAPDGSEAARYPGHVVALYGTEHWVVIRAVWTYRQVDLDGSCLYPATSSWSGFRLTSLSTPLPSLRPAGIASFKANVAYPARLDKKRVSAVARLARSIS